MIMDKFKGMDSEKVFEMFHALSQVPRCSKQEEKVSNWLKKWAEERNLEVIQDEANNIIIKKDGTAGKENAPTVILQAHMDMVCEKGKDSKHNFETDPIEWVIKDDHIFANDTTLGADDGIGVAFAMALLDSNDIPHPPLEVIITTDEETGMTGAIALDPKLVSGKTFINIDSEEEGKFYLSCAGGNETRIRIPVSFEEVVGLEVELEATGLLGGHSGLEIHKDRANSSKVIGRLLNILIENNINYNLVSVDGGNKINAITRSTIAKIVIDEKDLNAVEAQVAELNKALKEEYTPQDPDAHVELRKGENKTIKAMTAQDTKRVVYGLVMIPCGPTHYSKYLEDLVQTSTNIGVVETHPDRVEFGSALRSSIISQKTALLQQHEVLADLIDAEIESFSFYPAWPYDANSKIKDIFLETYKELFNVDAEAVAIHAGLECGLFKEKLGDDVDFISFGPQIEGAHTAEENLSISSTDRNWKLFKAVINKL